MTENVENLILEHLKRFQAGQDRIERDVSEIKTRLANLESGQASIIQHLAHLASADAAQQVTMDSMSERLNRMERRLELND
jgi:uncharacterized coiled-coil protein SlyX